MTVNLEFDIYVYLNGNLVLDDRTATGIANAMRISKDTTGDHLHKMVQSGLLISEPIGSAKVYFVKIEE